MRKLKQGQIFIKADQKLLRSNNVRKSSQVIHVPTFIDRLQVLENIFVVFGIRIFKLKKNYDELRNHIEFKEIYWF